MREQVRRRWRIVRNFALLGLLGGAAYGLVASNGELRAPLQGAVTGLFISGVAAWFEAIFMRSTAGKALQRLSFARLLALKTVIYVTVIFLGTEAGDLAGGRPLALDRALFLTILAGLAVSIVANFVMQVNLMLGQGELARFMRGRYHHPREEERIFLFLDLVGSTALAERIGGVPFLELLSEVYGEIAGPILEYRGEIHKYVGDEVIVTWRPETGLPAARCVACALAIQTLLAERASSYRARYDAEPAFRFGLHLGRVVSGEIGSVKQEIAYLGDPVNITARLIDVCRERGKDAIASGALLDRLSLPAGVRAEPLGAVTLRGRQAALPLFALSAA
jgi:adenylate cyclase